MNEWVPAFCGTARRFTNALRIGVLVLGVAQLLACSNNPPTPDWQVNSHGALNSYTVADLSGNSAVANVEFTRARQEIASTGRPDWLARVEAVRCAVRVASLVLDDCAGFNPFRTDAAPAEQAYVRYLSGQAPLTGPQTDLLPAQHRAVLASRDEGSRIASLNAMADPLARLIAAGVLLQQGLLSPAGVQIAVRTASDQGWRRPLLAWLGVQLKLAQTHGDATAQAAVQRRIDLVGRVTP